MLERYGESNVFASKLTDYQSMLDSIGSQTISFQLPKYMRLKVCNCIEKKWMSLTSAVSFVQMQ